ncbi:MAG TPA: hypothetical protein VNH83_20205 [Bryobacteraceae bacterium]|nr:hypothetical protein [Bryobacteraceae bacterium]
MTVHTIADIVGSSTAVRLVATPGLRARWILFCSEVGVSNVGDANVSASRGVDLPAAVPVIFPQNGADQTDAYDLYNTWVFVPTSSTLTVTYGV